MNAMTQGNWTVEKDGTTVTMGGQCVIVSPAPDGATMEETRANAKVIAAAPDLRAAAKLAFAALNASQSWSDQTAAAFTALGVAIKKAKVAA